MQTRSLPDYYAELAPFADLFRQGQAILCYHKIAKPPKHARIKGLYLDPALFSRQMEELSSRGFASDPPGRPDGTAKNRFTISFDDGFLNNLTEALPRMQKSNLRAINYLVADRLGQTSDWEGREGGEADPLMSESQIKEWLSAGHWIGAHTCTHPRLSRLSREQAKEEIFSSKKKLEDRFGIPVEHFAYPYGDYNQITVELVRSAGFKTACTMHRGINLPATSLFELKRWTARYPSRNLRNLLRKLFG
ncbi:MAG: polysaccharide deacetylase family protein [Verrucomicrobia bacterium]|nr:polysaccharide deacetylase family protein [bacterium]NBV96128.1 polysaccharide deacetylase family protein [Verrucomicrobiota bacterium]NBY65646.1 polysaccharide deacetylase family protein [Verrucomicrobiota bacterium]